MRINNRFCLNSLIPLDIKQTSTMSDLAFVCGIISLSVAYWASSSPENKENSKELFGAKLLIGIAIPCSLILVAKKRFLSAKKPLTPSNEKGPEGAACLRYKPPIQPEIEYSRRVGGRQGRRIAPILGNKVKG